MRTENIVTNSLCSFAYALVAGGLPDICNAWASGKYGEYEGLTFEVPIVP